LVGKIKNYDMELEDLPIEELSRIVGEATARAADEFMEIMGYNVIALNGWVVKIFPDGSIEKISEIKKVL